METRALTLRLPADQAAQLEAVARADGVSVSEAVRAAIADRIEGSAPSSSSSRSSGGRTCDAIGQGAHRLSGRPGPPGPPILIRCPRRPTAWTFAPSCVRCASA